ncbi:hypothetical protein [Pseudomonas amygdali]|uniref:hypothetical protein n=1 Tax=Pseudomonas amygdali TaxID=47877 RepID=UPI0006E6DAB9|nr:hypothetical protein [Pseudomonas amygdali]KPY55670.1 hypothetical protein ALO93_200242 [Pseudomonas amygdali pv. sesami]
MRNKRSTKSFDDELITRFRVMTVEQIARILGLYCKQDKEYESSHYRNAKCFHISKDGEVFEIIVSQLKWYSTHRRCGGGGGIDLTMHIFGESFKAALTRLALGLERLEAENLKALTEQRGNI